MSSVAMRPAPRLSWLRILLYALMIALAAFYVLPVYLMLITSFKSFDQVSLSRMWDLPQGLYFESFARAWGGMGRGFINSVLVVIPATVISCLLGSMNGYILSKWRFPGSEILFTLIL